MEGHEGRGRSTGAFILSCRVGCQAEAGEVCQRREGVSGARGGAREGAMSEGFRGSFTDPGDSG